MDDVIDVVSSTLAPISMAVTIGDGVGNGHRVNAKTMLGMLVLVGAYEFKLLIMNLV